MKVIVTGSLGHISKPLTQALLQQGHQVTVISSDPEKEKDIEALGASAAIGTIEDVNFLTKTFTGADAVYTMLPPPNLFDPNLDIKSDFLNISNNYVQAIQQSGVKRVVHLSSVGAHLDQGTGFILFHRQAESILSNLQEVAITFMRPVGFYYNLFTFSGVIKATGVMSSNYGADDIIPWVSPIDIATAIAEELTTPQTGNKVRYVASEELTCNEVASTLGAAIGQPDLQWILITDEELQSRYESMGMNKTIVAWLAEMQANMHNGAFYEDYYLNRPALGKVKLTEFAKEFAAAF
ncbi:NAD(P)H-binding protein [Candidatus Methylospira mobilis]|uniref:NAD(P)H-binding protein n=1 Tax=Candidatus Methylospira mobilis TaxID=1808979 RepID=A0A5Q0BS82_9GAMM|nr:NAD(P)H-binding protein [Candidatus Methylospira mobilis]QFY44546.1 NAD(P)H-binding protein [Candidatus Methylospira mobilis]